MIIYLIFLVLGIYCYYYLIKPFKIFNRYKKYGEGFFFPLIGEFILQNSCLEKFGDVDYIYKHINDNPANQKKMFVENIGKNIKIKLTSIDMIKDFYSYVGDQLTIDTFYTQNFKRIFGNGLVFSSGEKWKNMRRMFSPAFHFEYLKNLSSSIEKIADQVLLEYISQNRLHDVNIISMISEMTSQVVFFSFLGNSLQDIIFQGKSLAFAITHILSALSGQVMELGYLLFGAKYLKLGIFKQHRELENYLQEFKSFFLDIIKSKKEELQKEYRETGDIKQNCVLSILIKENNIQNLSDSDLLDNLMTFFIGGTDTTSHLIAMAIYYVCQNEHYYRMTQKEVDYYKQDTSKSIQDLPFMDAVINETLRIYGPGNKSFDQKVTEDITINNIKIEKDIVLTSYVNSVHRDPQIYKEPHSFRPQRWINEETKYLPPFAFLPFSSGKKNCIGQHLAMIETRIILFKFFDYFDIEPQKDYVLKIRYGLLPEPVNPLLFNLKPRHNKLN
ncbi:hypothetical protein ABPG74_001159 [Tetrahymena malaccensis]